jgi:hypothetical protein
LQVKEDWVYMAMVIDRFLLWLYISLSVLCTLVLLLNAPALYDNRPGLRAWNKTVIRGNTTGSHTNHWPLR